MQRNFHSNKVKSSNHYLKNNSAPLYRLSGDAFPMYQNIKLSLLSIVGLSMLSLGEASAVDETLTLDGLKEIQTKVRSTVESVLPATISLNSTQANASGSGVIVSKEGLILTAAHVVQGSDEMTVIFPDGQQANAKVLGAHFTRDSAMMQITDPAPSGGWPYVEMGEAKQLNTGDLVIAMGHPGGYDPIRTPPVRFGRFLSRSQDHFFNTDCAIIGGDSGGPLFNLEGQVIGIHSSIANNLNANNHASITGFKQDWEKLTKGKQWGQLGRSGLQDEDAPVLGIITERFSKNGLFITELVPNGPAHQAGIKQGDLIQKVNQRKTHNLEALQIELSVNEPGDNVKIEVLRDNKTIQHSVTLASRGDIFKLFNP